jgi:uncharacterized secreted protein with C-terminal beta-propeller domain
MRFLLLPLLFISFIYAQTTIEFKQGWQLVGIPSYLEDISLFNNKDVEIVWGFDAQTQSWRGYSPDSELEQKMIEKDIALLDTLEPWQAVWVYSTNPWSLDVSASTIPTKAKNNTITLYKGWNLIEIPQQSVVSDSFFGDAVVWKYSSDNKWLVNDETLDFPSIETISVSEGVWVKSKTTREIKVDEELSALQNFKSEDAMLSYIRTMLKLNRYGYYGYLDYSVAPEISGVVADGSNPTSDNDASTTNLQEEGVDEGDILKHDGTYIYSVDNSAKKIVVSSFDKITANDYKALNEIDMQGKTVVAMYLQNNRLSVISNMTYYYIYSDIPEAKSKRRVLPPNANSTQQFSLDIFDVSDINNISLFSSYEIDGNYQDSRLIDGNLFLISQFYPNIEYEYIKLYVDTVCTQLDRNQINQSCYATTPDSKPICETGTDYQEWIDNSCYEYNYDSIGAWKYDYDNPIVASENLIPNIFHNGESTALVTPSKFYAPNKLDQSANITTISSFDINTAQHKDTISFLGNTNNYYASLTSLYLVSSEYPYYYDFTYSKSQQMIYKFSLSDTLEYEGRGLVDGVMLNQFSMSEKDDYLRVATTIGNTWSGDGTQNSVFTLKQLDKNLEVVATLSGLGKENETIKAVRFMGERGFVVTFRQTDPLYTLDLSDPLNPKKVGELLVNGFSEYLHVIDENRLLSIGRDADESGRRGGLQISVFDISDFSNPLLADKVTIGSSSTYSEAEYNHKAFTYRSSDNIFAIPYTDYNSEYTESFGFYELDGMKIKSLKTISTKTPDNWGNSARGLIFDNSNSIYGVLFKGSNIMSEIIK